MDTPDAKIEALRETVSELVAKDERHLDRLVEEASIGEQGMFWIRVWPRVLFPIVMGVAVVVTGYCFETWTKARTSIELARIACPEKK